MKKIVSIIVCVVLIVISFVCGFFVGRIGMKEDNKVGATSGSKSVKINEPYKLTLLELTLKNVEFNKEICACYYHENFLYSFNNDKELKEHTSEVYNGNYKIQANEGYIYATIEYTLKNISNEKVNLENIDAKSRFKFLYDNTYYFEDNRTNVGLWGNSTNGNNAYVKRTSDSKISWTQGETVYLLNPLSDEVTIREIILVPEKVANDKEKSLVLIKEFSNSNSLVQFERESVYIEIR